MNSKDVDLAAVDRNSKDVGPAAVDRNSPESARKRRGWFGRNWLWFIIVDLLVFIAIGAGWGYWSFFGRVYCLDEYRSAMEKIAGSDQLRSKLGEPIQAAGWPPPSPRLEGHEREVRWDIQGPKGRAKAHVLARLMQGKWEFILMEVTLANGRKVSLVEENGDAGDAPPWLGTKPESEKPQTDAPPPVINMPTPDVQVPEGL